MLRAVLFDVDFTLAKPGPDLGPEGYRRLGERFGLDLDPSRYDAARAAAVSELKRHPELDHDEEVWVAFTVEIVRHMGGDGEAARACCRRDGGRVGALAQLRALRGRAARAGGAAPPRASGSASSRTPRATCEHFVSHHGLDVDAVVSSGYFGKTKPHPSIFEHVLGALEVAPADAAMVGDSVEDDIEGARALGMRAFLLDRDGRFPDAGERLTGLMELPAALGLAASRPLVTGRRLRPRSMLVPPSTRPGGRGRYLLQRCAHGRQSNRPSRGFRARGFRSR